MSAEKSKALPVLAFAPSLVLGSLFGYTMPSYSAELQGTARVNIVSALSVQEISPVDFGSLATPANSASCTLQGNGQLISESAFCNGTGKPGVVQISGKAGESVSVKLLPGSSDNIQFIPELIDSSEQVLLNQATQQLIVGGELVVNAANGKVPIGAQQIAYQIVAHYE